MVNTMKQHNPITDKLRRVCQRAEAATADAVAELRGQVGAGLSRAALGELAETVKRMEAQVSSLKCDLAGQLSRADGGAGADHVLRDQLGMTNHGAKHLSRVAQKLEEMPNTRAKLQAGEITLENATALTAAAGECGAAQVDQNRDLLENAARTNPDHFRKEAKQWANAHSADRGEKLLERQRRLRKVKMFTEPGTGMGILHAELDPIRFGQVRQALDLHAENLRRADSGGEAHPDDIRTNPQRRADALVELLTGRDADTMRPLPDNKSGKAVTQLVVVADLGLLDGTRPDGSCEILGSGPVPPSLLADLSPDDNVCGIIFGGDGRVLWLGRSRRLGNDAQRLAAAVRDRGCVRCDISSHQTDLHHLLDWRDGGPTDIDNLALLCGPHHRQLQEHNLELEKNGKRWQTRPRSKPPNAPPPSTRTVKPPARAGPAP